MEDYINLNENNIENEHVCCIIRERVKNPGIEAKKAWLIDRLKEGHVFRKLNVKDKVFVEYAPLESAWVPIEGDNYYYIYCLWVGAKYKGKGYAKALMNYCIDEAKIKGKSGVCLLGAKKQKAWLSSQSFAEKYGFKVVDETDNGYELFALSFDGIKPKFKENAKKETIENKELTIYYDMQCPYIYQNIKIIEKYCKEKDIAVSLIEVNTVDKAKNLPCVFNNYAVFYKGKFQTVNLLDISYLERILKK